MVGRRWSADLAIAYYQYARSIETGESFGPPLEGGLDTDSVHNTFVDMVEAITEMETGNLIGSNEDDDWFLRELETISDPNSLLIIPDPRTVYDPLNELDNFQGPNYDISYEDFEWPEDMDYQSVLDAFAPYIRDKTIGARENEERIPESAKVDRALKHARTGNSGAGIVDWAVMQGGRNTTSYARRRDSRVKVVARMTSANPCAFCAMLASRGFVYASEESALAGTHPNCKCETITRWKDGSPEPERIAFLKKAWEDNIAGTPGGYTAKGVPNQLNTFRRWLYNNHRNGLPV